MSLKNIKGTYKILVELTPSDNDVFNRYWEEVKVFATSFESAMDKANEKLNRMVKRGNIFHWHILECSYPNGYRIRI